MLAIKKEHHAQRCEICHQSDFFAPEEAGYCSRCNHIEGTHPAAFSVPRLEQSNSECNYCRRGVPFDDSLMLWLKKDIDPFNVLLLKSLPHTRHGELASLGRVKFLLGMIDDIVPYIITLVIMATLIIVPAAFWYMAYACGWLPYYSFMPMMLLCLFVPIVWILIGIKYEKMNSSLGALVDFFAAVICSSNRYLHFVGSRYYRLSVVPFYRRDL